MIKTEPTGILLDNNVWRYVIDCNAEDELVRRVGRSRATILIAPSVVYEALRTGDPRLRARLARLMCKGDWKRLLPEAYEEAAEFAREAQRLRPSWLQHSPDARRFLKYRKDWTRPRGGFWSRCRSDPTAELRALEAMGDSDLHNAAWHQTKLRRDAARTYGLNNPQPLNDVREEPATPAPGWHGDAVEGWRLSAEHAFLDALLQSNHPYRDWLEPWFCMSRALASPSSWFRFWAYEVEAPRMPRAWLRWAMEYLQQFRSVNAGTACDIQLSTYLPDTKLFVSADDRFLKLIEECRPYSPVDLPATALLSGGREGVGELMELIVSSTATQLTPQALSVPWLGYS